jgi:hypothetical protein
VILTGAAPRALYTWEAETDKLDDFMQFDEYNALEKPPEGASDMLVA